MLVPVGILTMYLILCLLDGIVGVFEREHGVRVHEVSEVLVVSALAHAALSFPTFDSLWMWHWRKLARRNAHMSLNP